MTRVPIKALLTLLPLSNEGTPPPPEPLRIEKYFRGVMTVSRFQVDLNHDRSRLRLAESARQ